MQSIPSEYPYCNHRITYFDTAGRSVLPQSVEAAGLTAVKQKSQPWNGVGSEEDIATVRESFASLIDAESSSIALTPSTGFAMTLVAKNVVKSGKLSAGKVVVILGKEMGSAVYPWQEACAITGASFRVVADPFLAGSDITWTEAILKAIDESVAVVALPMVHWCNGALIDLKAISARLGQFTKESKPLLVVDGTQSLGALPLSVTDVHADVIACSVHKWLNCPYGMSLLYIHPDYHTVWEPLDHHERGRVGSNEEGWDEVIFMHPDTGFYPQALFPDARRFDAGGKANPVTVPMVRAGLQTVLSWTPNTVLEHCATLTDAIAAQLQSVFGEQVLIRPKPQRSAHIFGVRFCPTSVYHSISLIELNKELKKENVFVSVRGEWLRVSVYLHNSKSDVHRFVSLFVQLISRMHHLSNPQCPLSSTCAAKVVRVLVTGSAGWLAQFVSHALLPHTILPYACNTDTGVSIYELYHAYSNAVPHWAPASHRVHLDLTNTNSIHATIAAIRPDIIIHTAALSSPVVCHKDEHRAYAVNCPTALIEAVQEHVPGALFLFTSTDMVYDGEHAPNSAVSTNETGGTVDANNIHETTPVVPQPVNVYGATKLAFEQEVLKLQHGVILRLSNMIGAPYKYQPAGAKFLEWLYGAYTRREYVGLKQQEIRSFVHVHDVVRVITLLMERYMQSIQHTIVDGVQSSACKVYNMGGPQPMSRLDVAHALCNALGTQLTVHDDCKSRDPSSTGSGAKKEVGAADPWEVYIMDPLPVTSVKPVTTDITTSILSITSTRSVFTELYSPKDISMNSTATEREFGNFANIDAILLDSLFV